MYEIDFDEKNRVLTTRFFGFWGVADVKRYGEEFATTLRRLKPRYPDLSLLADVREMSVTTPEVSAAFATLSDDENFRSIQRSAVVVAKMLSKLQVERTSHQPLGVFFDEAEARAWLSAPLAD